jgi:hypothetical protein
VKDYGARLNWGRSPEGYRAGRRLRLIERPPQGAVFLFNVVKENGHEKSDE